MPIQPNMKFDGVGRQNPLAVNLLNIVAWSAIFLPGHLLDWTVERAFALAVAVLGFVAMLLFKLPSRLGPHDSRVLFFVLLCIELGYLLGYVISITVYSIDTGIRDYIEIFRYLIWFFFFALLMAGFSRKNLKFLEIMLKVSLIYSLAVWAVLHFKIPGIAYFFSDILYDRTKTDMISDFGRLAVPFENPNFLAFYLVMCLSYFLYFYKSIDTYFWMTVIIVLLFISGSRSGWVASAFVCVMFVLLSITSAVSGRQRGISLRAILVLVLVLVLGSGVWAYSDALLATSRVVSTLAVFDNGEIVFDANLAQRVDMILVAWNHFIERPLLGWGSAKYAGMDVTDHQFALWLMRNGLVGTFFILASLMLYLLYQIKLANDARDKFGVLVFWAAVFIMLQGGAFFENFRLGFLFFIFTMMMTASIESKKIQAVD